MYLLGALVQNTLAHNLGEPTEVLAVRVVAHQVVVPRIDERLQLCVLCAVVVVVLVVVFIYWSSAPMS
jgi:uncharacterized membrane protein YGL010W